MCTLVVLFRPDHDWPLVLGANRDEMIGRPWLPPARHWPDRAEVVAGRDETAGGTWLGVNDYGVVAAVLNRVGSLGPAEGYRSRGELPLEALDHADASAAAHALSHLDARAYRSFNMVIADNRDVYWLAHKGEGHGGGGGAIDVHPIEPGLSMLTANDLNDRARPRIRTYLPRFRAAAVPEPSAGEWSDWQQLFASRTFDPADGPTGAMTIVTEEGFGTVSSSLIALPSMAHGERKPVWLFAAGRPGEVPWDEVEL